MENTHKIFPHFSKSSFGETLPSERCGFLSPTKEISYFMILPVTGIVLLRDSIYGVVFVFDLDQFYIFRDSQKHSSG